MPKYKMLVRKYIVQETYITITAKSNLIAEEKARQRAKRDDISIKWHTCDSVDAFLIDDPANGPNIIKTEVINE